MSRWEEWHDRIFEWIKWLWEQRIALLATAGLLCGGGGYFLGSSTREAPGPSEGVPVVTVDDIACDVAEYPKERCVLVCAGEGLDE